MTCHTPFSATPLQFVPTGIRGSTRDNIGQPTSHVYLGSKCGQGWLWTAYDAAVVFPDGSRHENLVWELHIPFFEPTPAETAQVADAIANEMFRLREPLAQLQGETVPRMFGVWDTPDGEAHVMLMENGGRLVTRAEAADPRFQ